MKEVDPLASVAHTVGVMPKQEITIKPRRRLRTYGLADKAAKTIWFRLTEDPHQDLDSLIHETLHVLLPEASEKEIQRLSEPLMNIIWAWGFRPARKPWKIAESKTWRIINDLTTHMECPGSTIWKSARASKTKKKRVRGRSKRRKKAK
jgi:hypothetical protein